MLTAYLLCVDGVPAEVVTPVANPEDVYISERLLHHQPRAVAVAHLRILPRSAAPLLRGPCKSYPR